MGLSAHEPKMAATAPGFTFSNADKGRKQRIGQYINKELFLCVSLLLLIRKKCTQKSPSTELGHRASPKCKKYWNSERPSRSGSRWKSVRMAVMEPVSGICLTSLLQALVPLLPGTPICRSHGTVLKLCLIPTLHPKKVSHLSNNWLFTVYAGHSKRD